jgi:hypothetical protein
MQFHDAPLNSRVPRFRIGLVIAPHSIGCFFASLYSSGPLGNQEPMENAVKPISELATESIGANRNGI